MNLHLILAKLITEGTAEDVVRVMLHLISPGLMGAGSGVVYGLGDGLVIFGALGRANRLQT